MCPSLRHCVNIIHISLTSRQCALSALSDVHQYLTGGGGQVAVSSFKHYTTHHTTLYYTSHRATLYTTLCSLHHTILYYTILHYITLQYFITLNYTKTYTIYYNIHCTLLNDNKVESHITCYALCITPYYTIQYYTHYTILHFALLHKYYTTACYYTICYTPIL